MSSWFRDYLYIPLGGSKQGLNKTIRNTFIIFLVSGFWHGANWTFIAWGLIHALGFLPLLISGNTRQTDTMVVAENNIYPTLQELLKMIATFIFVTFAWIFFRALTISDAIQFILQIFTPQGNHSIIPSLKATIIIPVLGLFYFDWRFRKNERNLNFFSYRILNWTLYLSLSVSIILYFFENQNASDFIYFQFYEETNL